MVTMHTLSLTVRSVFAFVMDAASVDRGRATPGHMLFKATSARAVGGAHESMAGNNIKQALWACLAALAAVI